MTSARILDLAKRLQQVEGAGKPTVPSWLEAVASEDELAEWQAIRKAYPFGGHDYADRMAQFIRRMRQAHPSMATGFEEEIAIRGLALQFDPEGLQQEGFDDNDPLIVKARRILEELTPQERTDLSNVIVAIKRSSGDAVGATVAGLPTNAKAVWEKARALADKGDLREAR